MHFCRSAFDPPCFKFRPAHRGLKHCRGLRCGRRRLRIVYAEPVPDPGHGANDHRAHRGRGRVPALTRAATVLQLICDNGRPMTLAELAQLSGYPKSSVMGICHALTSERPPRSRGRRHVRAGVARLRTRFGGQGATLAGARHRIQLPGRRELLRRRDRGPARGGRPSSVRDCTCTPPRRTETTSRGRSLNSSTPAST